MTGDMSEIVGFIESGDVRGQAVLTVERVPGLKDIPTAVEQGIDVVAVNWCGLYVPKDISDEDFNAWAARLQAVTESDDWKTAMMENGLAPFTKVGDDFQRWVYGVIASTEEPSVRLALFSNAYLGPHFRGRRDPWVDHLRDGGPGHRKAVFCRPALAIG
jgi:putative tricarboxylic transport membrane protein